MTISRNCLIHRRSSWRPLILIAAAVAGIAATATAQEYRTDPVDEKLRQLRARERSWTTVPARYAAEKAEFTEYFEKYYFPDMTRSGDAELGRLGESRHNLFKRYLWATSNEELQQDLTKLAYKKMYDIIAAKDPPYHPAVRYNAVLILGMLDQQYAIESGANRRPPRPLPEANAFLTQIVGWAADDKAVPPAVVFGALIGLDRHAQFRESLTPEAMSAMNAALIKLVSHDKPIQEMDRASYGWMRMRAAGVLARLGNVGQNNAVHNAIIKLASDSKSLDDRCAAAALLQKISYKDVKLDDVGTAEPLFALARDLGAAEAQRAQDFEDQIGGSGFAGGGRPPDFGLPDGSGEQETFPRRQVLARLIDLRGGLNQVKPALPAETQKKVDALLEALKPAIAAISSKETVELRLTEALRTMAEAINRAVPPAEKPADEKAAEAF